MANWKFISVFFFFSLMVLSPFLHAGEPVEQEERDAIQKRAAELAPLLSSQPFPLIPPISDRKAWEEFASYPSNKSVIKKAEKIMNDPIVIPSEDLYKEFYRNGNRSNYQRAVNLAGDRLGLFATAELIENKGRFLPALSEVIRFYCAYPSWLLPAHDEKAQVYDGKVQRVDLVSARVSAELAVIRQAFIEVLDPEITGLIEENIRKRTLDPLRLAIESPERSNFLWWVTTTNNWNSVCFCNTTAAALALCEDPEERAWYLAAAEYFVSNYYFRGFTDDGYCSEGLSYWNYGFMNFAQLAEMAYRVSNGALNLYLIPKVRAVSEYPQKIEVAPGLFANIADSPISGKPSGKLQAHLSRRLGLGETELEEKGTPPNIGTTSPVEMAAFFFNPDLESVVTQTEAKEHQTHPIDQPFTYFSDVNLLICRGIKDDDNQIFGFIKGGNNNEHHNHNDLGVFGVIRDSVWLIIDPGSETYTARTFSSKRYLGELLNSYGHSVPRINGHLQVTGSEAQAVVLESEFTSEEYRIKYDLTSAYPDSGAARYERSFSFKYAPAGNPNSITITDHIIFISDDPKEFDIPFVTFESWEQLSESEFRIFSKKAEKPGILLSITAENENHIPVTGILTEQIIGEKDDAVPVKPTRITWTANLETGTAVTVITQIKPE